VKIFKVKTETSKGEPVKFALKAKTYKQAESKAVEIFVKLGVFPVSGFFTVNQVKRKKKG
jgi:hypothetical protein